MKAATPYGRLMRRALILATLTLAACGSTAKNPAADPNEAVYRQCVESATTLLKSPATAQFQPFATVQVVKRDDGGVEITGDVDSQNGFGALVRSTYVCIVDGSGRLNVSFPRMG